MTSPLRDRTVLITGAARGIGEHVARLAAARGARVALVGLEPERLAAIVEELNAAQPDRHLWCECDVTDQGGLDEAVRRALARTGRIDAVVANAGVASIGTVAVTDVEALVRTVDINLSGVMRTVAATLPHVREQRGYLLLVSSAAAFTAMPGMAAYCASKAGVEQFGNVLRQEVAHTGVRVGTAHPGWIETDMVRGFRADVASFQDTVRRLPWPLRSTISVQQCAEAMVRGVAGRRRRVYIPRAIGGVQALRALVLSPFTDAVIKRLAATAVPEMEAEARQLGRAFGAHSIANTPRKES